MQPILLKTTKPINYEGKLKDYMIKNFEAGNLPDEVQNFLIDLQQNHSVISTMEKVAQNLDSLRVNKDIVLNYINQINLLKQKMSFGKEPFSVKIEFIWLDIFRNGKWKSYNINFEFYNALFNLGTIYYVIGYHMKKEDNNEEGYLKEISKYYRYAFGIYELIKNESNLKIDQKEIPYDLFTSYLEYCCLLCQIKAQLILIKIATQKNTKFDLIAKLTLGVSNLYKEASSHFNNLPLSKFGDSDFRDYLLNRSHYYYAEMLLRYYDNEMKRFNETGEGYGHALAYLFLATEQFSECNKTAKKLPKLIDSNALDKKIAKLTEIGTEMYDKNNRVYRNATPDLRGQKYESKVMITSLLPDDLFKLNVNLGTLVPTEIKGMIDNYKEKLMQFITEKLNALETPDSIENYIQNLHLPDKFVLSNIDELQKRNFDIPNDLWNMISQIQQLGGINQLNNIMQNIMQKTGEMGMKLNNCLNLLKQEENEDNFFRQRFQNQWNNVRRPSNQLNFNIKNAAEKYISNLNQTKQYDLKEKDAIVYNIKNFELLNLPKEALIEKIPKAKLDKPKKLSKEEQKVRDGVQNLLKLKKDCFDIINPIFDALNDESQITPSFMEVLSKKTTEQAILEKSKSDFEVKFSDLEKLSVLIKKDKTTLEENIHQIANELAQPKQNEQLPKESEDFIKQLYDYCKLYLQKNESLKKGLEYYISLEKKINEIEIGTQKFIQQRNIEKEAIVQNLTGMSYNQYCNQGRGNQGNNYNNFGNTNDFLDPNQNLYTNLNVTKNINYGNNNNRMNYMNNQNNQNYFNPNMYQQNNNNMSNMNNNHPFRNPGFNDNQSGYPQNNNNNNFGLP